HDLTDIVTRLMDYAYIDSGQMQAQIEELQLADEIEELLDALGATLAGASVEVAVPVAAVAADRVLLRRVLVNLLTNAKKYGGEHSAVIISVELSGDLAKVSVTDQGPGIAADELPNVFEAFWRSGRDHQKRQGTGIGLALVQDYTRLMGGTVGVESVVGTGTTFWFTLPLAQPLSSENE
ncbi:MAG: sensor histidine kinase, partial [Acidimicrobiales bacterium]